MAKVIKTSYERDMALLMKAMDGLAEAAYDEFIKNTPIRTGNARRNTRLNQDTITANYPYAQRLDEGSSKQSPDGMTAPTMEFIEKVIERRLRRLKYGK